MTPLPEEGSTTGEMVLATAHLGTNLAVLLGGAVLGVLATNNVVFTIDARGLSGTVLQVAGTMVALALPAGQFGQQMVAELDRQMQDKLLPGQDGETVSKEARIRAVRVLTEQLRAKLLPAWRAAAYALVSFLLACAASVAPSKRYPLSESVFIQIDHCLTAIALLALVAAAVWIYPTARYAFGLRSIRDMRDDYVKLIEKE